MPFPRRAASGPVETIIHRGITMGLEYRAVKSLRMTVYPDCRVLVVAPRTVTPEQVGKFIESRSAWLENHLVQYRERARKKPLAKNRFARGELYYVWGAPFRLEVVECRGRPGLETLPGPADTGADTTRAAGILRMQVKPGTTAAEKQALLDRWRKQLLAEAAPLVTARWEKPLEEALAEQGRRGGRHGGSGRGTAAAPFKVEKIFFQKMKTHWGSCNHTRKTIRLNTELAAKSPECLDYVVLHEMIHLIEASHNSVFYGFMNTLLPGWKEIRKKMNTGGL